MAGFLKNVIGRLGAKGSAPAPGVSVGLFGKHPCFDDHFFESSSDVGRLQAVMALLYTQGIGRNIDTGAWTKLNAADRLAGFNHIFVWHVPGSEVVGRMWPSSDNKNRKLYPLVLCAECRGIDARQAARLVIPRLQALHDRGEAAPSREVLREQVRAEQAGLHQVLQHSSGHGADEAPSDAAANARSAALQEMAGCPGMGPRAQGVYRLLYRLHMEAPAALADASRSGAAPPPPIHLRLPRCADSAEEAVRRWSGWLPCLLHAEVPWLIAAPTEGNWIDLVVGEPAPPHTFFLLSKREPLTTEIPYPIEVEFIREIDRQLGPAKPIGAPPASASGPAAKPANNAMQPSPLSADSAADKPGSPPDEPTHPSSSMIKPLLIGLVVVGLGGAGAWSISKMKRPEVATRPVLQTQPQTQETSTTRATGTTASTVTVEDPRHAWQADRELKEAAAQLKDLRTQLSEMGQELDSQTSKSLSDRADALGTKIESARLAVSLAKAPTWSDRAADQKTVRDKKKAADTALDEATHSAGVLSRKIATAVPDPRRDWLAEQNGRLATIASSLNSAAAGHADLPPQIKRDLDGFADQQSTVAKMVAQAASPASPWPVDAAARAQVRSIMTSAAQEVDALGTTARGIESEIRHVGAIPDPRPAWRLDLEPAAAAAKDLTDSLNADPAHPKELESASSDLVKEYKAAEYRVRDVGTDPWPASADDQAKIMGRVKGAEDELAKLKSTVAHSQKAFAGFYGNWLKTAVTVGRVAADSPAVVDAAWVKGRDQILKKVSNWNVDNHAPVSEVAAARTAFQDMHDLLAKLPAELPAWGPGPDAAWRAAAARAWAARRDKALEDAADQLVGACLNASKPKTSAETTVQAAKRWRSTAESVVSDLDEVQSQLAVLCPPVPAGGRSLADLCKDLDARLKDAPELNNAASDLRRRAGDVLAVSSMNRAALASALGNADPAAAWAAWRRLGEPALAWPKTADELQQESAAEKDLQAKLAGLPEARAAELNKELAAGWQSRYAAALDQAFSAKDENAVEAVVAKRRTDQSDSDLPAELRYDLKLHGLRRDVAKLNDGDGEGSRNLVKAFVAEVSKEGLDKDPAVAGLTRDLTQITDLPPKPVQPQSLPSPVDGGPVGWKKSVDADGGRVVFSKESPDRKLEFLLVQPKGDKPAYLCSTEVSVSLFAEIIAGAGAQDRKDVLDLFPGETPFLHSHSGPMSWTHPEGGGITVSDRWLRDQRLSFRDSSEQPVRQSDLYPAKSEVPKVYADCPMSYVSWKAASRLAALARCRLPMTTEWLAAYQSLPVAEQELTTDNWNLRDGVWADEDDCLGQLKLKLRVPWPCLPSRDRFSPSDVPDAEHDTKKIYPGAGRHAVWFEPVAPDADKHKFHNLVGNVAEYVVDANQKPAVIGGSKLSPPELKVDKPYAFDPEKDTIGFADVGLRLALDAGPGAMAAGSGNDAPGDITKIIQSAPYLRLPPR